MDKIYRAVVLGVLVAILLSASSATIIEAKGGPDTPPGQEKKEAPAPPGQDKKPETPPGHSNRPEETPSGTTPATPATPAQPNPGQGPATPATPAIPAQPGHKKEPEPEPEETGPLGYDVWPNYVWWSLSYYPTGGYNNLYPGAENIPGSWPITITAWETNYTSIDLYFAGTDFQSWYGYTFSISNLWVDDDGVIDETDETGSDPYQMQNTFSEEPVISGVEAGESVDIYFYLSFPEEQPITSYWAWLYIDAEPGS